MLIHFLDFRILICNNFFINMKFNKIFIKSSYLILSIIGLILFVLFVSDYSKVYARDYPFYHLNSFRFETKNGQQGLKYINNRWYAKEPILSVQYYGYYVVGQNYQGQVINAGCNLYKNNENNKINVDLDSFEKTNFYSDKAVKIVCKRSDNFTLKQGKNTLYLGGHIIYQTNGVIPMPAKYSEMVIYLDTIAPQGTLQTQKIPENCTKQALLSNSSNCDIKIKYKIYDPNDGKIAYIQLTNKVSGQQGLPTIKTIDVSNADNDWHTVTYNLHKDFGLNDIGTYTLEFGLMSQDEVGNALDKSLNVAVNVKPNPSPTSSITSEQNVTPTEQQANHDNSAENLSNSKQVQNVQPDNKVNAKNNLGQLDMTWLVKIVVITGVLLPIVLYLFYKLYEHLVGRKM